MNNGTPGEKPAAHRRRFGITHCASCGAQCDYHQRAAEYGVCIGGVLYVPDYGKCRRHTCEAHEHLLREREEPNAYR